MKVELEAIATKNTKDHEKDAGEIFCAFLCFSWPFPFALFGGRGSVSA